MSQLYPGGLPVALSLVGYNALLTGLFILLKRRDRIGIYYFFASLWTFGWGLGLSFMLNNDLSHPLAEFWGVFAFDCFFMMPVAWLHFVLVYTKKLKAFDLSLACVYAVTLLFLTLSASAWFISDFHEIVKLTVFPIPGPAFKALTLLFVVIAIYSFWELYEAWQEETSLFRKKDYQFLFWAQAYGYGLASVIFLPVYGFKIQQWNLLLLPVWQFLLVYAMSQRHLLDFEELAKAVHRDKLAVMATVAASMHHEIKNPLFIMQGLSEGYLHKIKSGAFSDRDELLKKTEDILARHDELLKRMMDIIHRFSQFAKRNVDEKMKIEAVSLQSVIDQILPLIRYELKNEKIRLSFDLPKDLPALRVDARHLEEILFNLLVNACHAVGEKGEILLKVNVEGKYLVLRIQDSGEGIAREDVKHLFEPFYTTKKKGTGLGLYVTKQLVEKNQGEISVQSQKGVGTTFTLRFIYSGGVSSDDGPRAIGRDLLK